MVLPSQEPEVQQKQADQAEAPHEQPASQLATPGASASEDATALIALDMSHQDSQAQMVMPGQAYTKLASRVEALQLHRLCLSHQTKAVVNQSHLHLLSKLPQLAILMTQTLALVC